MHHQYASAQRLATELPDRTLVMPTHGFGSFCSATQSEATASTIGAEKATNPVLTQDEQRYVTELLAGLDAFPAYYAQMGPANTRGPSAPDLSAPQEADARELRRRLEDGEWLIDLRTRTAFAAGHAPGTLNFGLDGSFATYLGWLIPWGTPVTLLGETADQVAEAQREMVRIGIDRPAAAATGGPDRWTDRPLRTVERATFADLAHVRHHRRWRFSTSGATSNGPSRTSTVPCTSHCTSSWTGRTRSRSANSGCTAPPVTGRRSLRRSCCHWAIG